MSCSLTGCGHITAHDRHTFQFLILDRKVEGEVGRTCNSAMSSLEKEITEGWTGNEPHAYRARVPRQANYADLATSGVRIEKQ